MEETQMISNSLHLEQGPGMRAYWPNLANHLSKISLEQSYTQLFMVSGCFRATIRVEKSYAKTIWLTVPALAF